MDLLTSRPSCILVFAFAWPVFAGSQVQGVKNFAQVDQHVYRGGQPTDEGFANLAKLGVKTVIDLREADGRAKNEESVVTAAGMKYVNVPMTGLTPPTESEISNILKILEDESAGPAFVHCMRGADRTGAVIAAYRIDHDRWDGNRALDEAKSRGMSIFQFPRKSFILGFQPRAIEAKADAPVPATSAGSLTTAPAMVR
jgi:tyrosine-protein phosphatase SIW14